MPLYEFDILGMPRENSWAFKIKFFIGFEYPNGLVSRASGNISIVKVKTNTFNFVFMAF